MKSETGENILRAVITVVLLSLVFGALCYDYVFWDCEPELRVLGIYIGSFPHFGATIILLILIWGILSEFFHICRLKGYHPASWAGILLALFTLVEVNVMAYQGYFKEAPRIEQPGVQVPAGPGGLEGPWYEEKLKAARANCFFNDIPYVHFGIPIATMILFFYLVFKLVFRPGNFNLADAALTMTGYIYVGMFLFAVPFFKFGTPFLFYLLAVTKGSDIGAYCIGKAFGKARIAPNLSPNKTWMGCIGGLVIAVLCGMFVFTMIWGLVQTQAHRLVPFTSILIWTIILAFAAQIGDFLGSAIKRWGGVRDSGYIPMVGGFMDMADSFVVSLPIAFYTYHIFYPFK
jgi:CDP-diglyceride synthetase